MTICTQDSITAYRIMWLYVMFDLPVETPKQRKLAAGFRNSLLKDGFGMYQFSVYIRHCASHEAAEVHIKRVKSFLPDEGLVSILKVTDKQFENTIHFSGKRAKPVEPIPMQMELF